MCHISCVRCHTSLFNLSQTVRARDLQFSHTIHYTLCVQCHLSGVTYQVSHVRCHMSLLLCHVPCVMCCVSYVIYIFKESALGRFFHRVAMSVCLCVCLSVCLMSLFMLHILRPILPPLPELYSESLGKSDGKKWSQI